MSVISPVLLLPSAIPGQTVTLNKLDNKPLNTPINTFQLFLQQLIEKIKKPTLSTIRDVGIFIKIFKSFESTNQP
jgi:hypothetical protein